MEGQKAEKVVGMAPSRYDLEAKMSEIDNERSDLQSLMGPTEPLSDPPEPLHGGNRKAQSTHFHDLNRALGSETRSFVRRTVTDYLIDAFTPFLILVMVYTVIFFLLDVRFVYTEVHNLNLRYFSFFFVFGVVALNRLIVKEGSGESYIYVVGLFGAVALYTFSTTGFYSVGSVARGFLNEPYRATAFNLMVVAFIWWLTNRLTHECCVDENRTAGDVGILTGTAQKIQAAIQRRGVGPVGKEPKAESKRPRGHVLEMMEIEAFDPTEWKAPEKEKGPPAPRADSQRLSRRHPGISIFYFSVPVMALFALGMPILMQGGRPFILAGHLYVGVYTVAALFLLLFTSLGGLRQYFRSRRVAFPSSIGWFWVGLGTVMIALVCIGAMSLPLPSLPPMAVVNDHEVDFWTKDSTFVLQAAAVTAADRLVQARFVDRISRAALVALGFFFVYGTLRGLGSLAAKVGRRRDLFPPVVVRFFDWLEAFLGRILKVPRLPSFRRRRRISRKLATCMSFQNPLRGEGAADPSTEAEYVAHSYDALCALALDMGVPRREDQTPYEYIESFPRALSGLKEEAMELTELYVRSAYSNGPLPERTLDRLRVFWSTYEKVRRRVVR